MTSTTNPVEMGTAFLTTPVSESADNIFIREELDADQRMIQEASATFVEREVLPRIEAIEHQEPGVLLELIKKAGEQGLLMVDVPVQYGGAKLGLLTSILIASTMREASFSVALGAHSTIGT